MEQYIIQIFSVVLNILLLYGFKKYNERQKSNEVKQQAIENGLRSLLRDRIIQSCISYMKQGNVLVEDMDNVTQMYNAYKDLGGNGAVEAVYKKFLSLPSINVHDHNHFLNKAGREE